MNEGSKNDEKGNLPIGGHPTAALVLGIVGIFASLIPIIGVPIQIIGLSILGKSLKSAQRGTAIAAMVLCVVGLILSVISGALGAYVKYLHNLTPDQICQRDVGPTSRYLGYKNADGTWACTSASQQNTLNNSAPVPFSDPANVFVCPENLPTGQQTSALAKFISAYQKANPNATVGDMETYRYNLLVSHSCNSTLQYMLQNVAPLDQMLRFDGEDFGPQITRFDNNTNVWSSYYTLGGQGLENPDEELIFNFYLQNVWSGQTSPQKIADTLAQGNNNIIYKFTATDDITHNTDYFVYSTSIYPNQNYGYLYLFKISSMQGGAFSVIYAKKFTGDASSLQSTMQNWLLQDLKSNQSISKILGSIGIDNTWVNYLSNKSK